MQHKTSVLDHGYVRLEAWMGDDLTPVNAARVSFDKRSEWESYFGAELKPKDKRLLHFLHDGGHTSPFYHAAMTFEIYAPLMVMRQWSKYKVGSHHTFREDNDTLEAWNESSRRYVTEDPVFYIPSEWRSAPENKKQGSGEVITFSAGEEDFSYYLSQHIAQGVYNYHAALDRGICAEEARLFLPAYAMYIRAWWTISLQGVIHFLSQRLKDDSQWEIRQYAEVIRDVVREKFPVTMEVVGL